AMEHSHLPGLAAPPPQRKGAAQAPRHGHPETAKERRSPTRPPRRGQQNAAEPPAKLGAQSGGGDRFRKPGGRSRGVEGSRAGHRSYCAERHGPSQIRIAQSLAPCEACWRHGHPLTTKKANLLRSSNKPRAETCAADHVNSTNISTA